MVKSSRDVLLLPLTMDEDRDPYKLESGEGIALALSLGIPLTESLWCMDTCVRLGA